jgi:hypothetical protein
MGKKIRGAFSIRISREKGQSICGLPRGATQISPLNKKPGAESAGRMFQVKLSRR